jgi:hypothetical protein
VKPWRTGWREQEGKAKRLDQDLEEKNSQDNFENSGKIRVLEKFRGM